MTWGQAPSAANGGGARQLVAAPRTRARRTGVSPRPRRPPVLAAPRVVVIRRRLLPSGLPRSPCAGRGPPAEWRPALSGSRDRTSRPATRRRALSVHGRETGSSSLARPCAEPGLCPATFARLAAARVVLSRGAAASGRCAGPCRRCEGCRDLAAPPARRTSRTPAFAGPDATSVARHDRRTTRWPPLVAVRECPRGHVGRTCSAARQDGTPSPPSHVHTRAGAQAHGPGATRRAPSRSPSATQACRRSRARRPTSMPGVLVAAALVLHVSRPRTVFSRGRAGDRPSRTSRPGAGHDARVPVVAALE
ncbi:hypothetical protein SBADM41S_07416 [Streptomyces badius]